MMENFTELVTLFLLQDNVTSNGSEVVHQATFLDAPSVPKAVQALMYIMYILISVAAVGGNVIVCYIVFAYQRMRSVTNFFIVNLAVGDILMAILCIPFGFVSNLLLQYWPFGAAMCVLVSYAQAVSVFVSAYTLVAISFDRYIAILYPLRPRMSKLQAKLIIALVWGVALLTPLPTALLSRLEQPLDWLEQNLTDRYTCMEAWESNTQRYHYSMALMVLQYFFPLVVLIYTYTRIAIVVWGKRTPGEAQDERDQRMAASKRKMVKMMIVCVFVFTLCWLPFNSLMVVGDQYPELYNLPNIIYLWFACHWLAMSHACYNPAIYFWMNEKFRHGFRMVFRWMPCVSTANHRMTQHSTMSVGVSMKMTTRIDAAADNSMIRMMITVVSVFTLCWLPLNTLIVVGDEHASIWQFPHIQYVWFVCHWLAMSSASYNPLIYCWMNAKYRDGFRQVLSCCGKSRAPAFKTSLNRNSFYTSIRSHRGSQCSHRDSHKVCQRTESGTFVVPVDKINGHCSPCSATAV